jgi:hypothetical protein
LKITMLICERFAMLRECLVSGDEIQYGFLKFP